MAARGKAARKPRTPVDCDCSIYDGATLLGEVAGRGGVFRATNASGKTLGKFKTAKEALTAIHAAARAARQAGAT